MQLVAKLPTLRYLCRKSFLRCPKTIFLSLAVLKEFELSSVMPVVAVFFGCRWLNRPTFRPPVAVIAACFEHSPSWWGCPKFYDTRSQSVTWIIQSPLVTRVWTYQRPVLAVATGQNMGWLVAKLITRAYCSINCLDTCAETSLSWVCFR